MKNLVYILFSLIILFGCAKRGTPSGGPKDSIPPILVNANPKLNSTNFDSEEIRLTFDEWIKLDKVQDQLIISPPLEKSSYEIKPLTGVTKKVFLNFLDSLTPETTYTINFGIALRYNENNPLHFLVIRFLQVKQLTLFILEVILVMHLVKSLMNLYHSNYIA